MCSEVWKLKVVFIVEDRMKNATQGIVVRCMCFLHLYLLGCSPKFIKCKTDGIMIKPWSLDLSFNLLIVLWLFWYVDPSVDLLTWFHSLHLLIKLLMLIYWSNFWNVYIFVFLGFGAACIPYATFSRCLSVRGRQNLRDVTFSMLLIRWEGDTLVGLFTLSEPTRNSPSKPIKTGFCDFDSKWIHENVPIGTILEHHSLLHNSIIFVQR